jgi:hypothetical protein
MCLLRLVVLCALLFATCGAVAQAEDAACAHSPAELRAFVYPAVPASTLRDAKSADYVFAANAQCLQSADEQRRAPALLIRIDKCAEPANLHLTSISGKEATLPARLQVLDENFTELKDYPFDRFVKRGMDYTLTLFLNPSPQPRYLLVMPDSEWLGRVNHLTAGNRWTAFWSTGTVMGTISNGTEVRRELPFGSGGTMRIEVETDNRVVGGAHAH